MVKVVAEYRICKSPCRIQLSRTPSRTHVEIHRFLSDQYCQCRISAAATVQMLHVTSGDALAVTYVNDTCLQDCRTAGYPFLLSLTVSAGSDGIARKKAVVLLASHGKRCKAPGSHWRATSYCPSLIGKGKGREKETDHMWLMCRVDLTGNIQYNLAISRDQHLLAWQHPGIWH